MASTEEPSVDHRPWSLFDVRVTAARSVTPRMVRLTLAADPAGPAHGATAEDVDGRSSLRHFADCGFDQRIKVVLPAAPGRAVPRLQPERWFTHLRTLPDSSRPIVRTYTVRAMREAGSPQAEIDIDVAVHGSAGPASAWALQAVTSGAGSTVTLLGPDSRCSTDPGGRAFVSTVTDDLLIAGDETALPAIGAILERLDARTTGRVLVEVPTADDVVSLPAPPGMDIDFLPRDRANYGARLVPSALGWRPAGEGRRDWPAGAMAEPMRSDAAADETLWDVPEVESGHGIRAWIAGEASSVRTIRRHLVGPCQLRRDEVAFMGYWRLGRSEN